MKYDVLVIGGGASGMMAAITAARIGVKVAVLEQNDRLGKNCYLRETANVITQMKIRTALFIIQSSRKWQNRSWPGFP